MSDAFSILIVCRANVCRSPLAETLMRAAVLEAGLGDAVSVSSAGTDAFVGEGACESAVAWSRVSSNHRARQLTREQLERADLVLTADRLNRSECAVLAPSCRSRLYTLPQAAFLAEDVDLSEVTEAGLPMARADRLRWLMTEWDAERVRLGGRDGLSDDIVDRHGLGRHDEVFQDAEVSVHAIAAALDRIAASPPI